MKSLVQGLLISKMPRGCRQAYCVKRLIRSPTPKPTSSPTLCFAWEKWEMILLRIGRGKINGIRKTITSKRWIESMESRWSSSGKYSQDSRRGASSRRFKVWWEIYSVNWCTSKAWSSSCQCSTTLHGMQKETTNNVCNTQAVANYARKFFRGHWLVFLGAWIRRKIVRNPNSQTRWIMGSTIHFTGSNENIELLLHIVISANQLSIYGAIADLCDEVPKRIRLAGHPASSLALGKLAAPKHLEKVEIPTVLSEAEYSTDEQLWGNRRQEHEQNFEQLSEDQKLSKLCSDAGLKLVEREQYFYTLETKEGQQMQHLCREHTLPRNEKGTRVRGWIRSNTRIGPVFDIKDLLSLWTIQYRSSSSISISRRYRFVG